MKCCRHPSLSRPTSQKMTISNLLDPKLILLIAYFLQKIDHLHITNVVHVHAFFTGSKSPSPALHHHCRYDTIPKRLRSTHCQPIPTSPSLGSLSASSFATSGIGTTSTKCEESTHSYVTSSAGKTSLLNPPLSLNPLICTSAKAILTPIECQVLSKWCREVVQREGKLTQEALTNSYLNGEEGAIIMIQLQQRLEGDILGYPKITEGDPCYVLPRFISYRYKEGDSVDRSNLSTSTLIPDGLHVDTNNSKHFRHW